MAEDEIEYDYGEDEQERMPSAREPRTRSRSPVRPAPPRPIDYGNRLPQYSQPQNAHQSRPEHRFFVLKCEYYGILAQAKKTRVWPARRLVGDRLASAFHTSSNSKISLFFTLEKAKCFVALGELDGSVHEAGRFSEVPVHWLSFRDVFFGDYARELREVFADGAQSTVRDGVELPYSVGKTIERAFFDSDRDSGSNRHRSRDYNNKRH